MQIEIVKQPDGGGVLRCIRQDSSITWQKQARHAAHFAVHDLTHFSVETVLGYRRGFFGLIAEGWDVDDTTGNGARGSLPAEALEVERIVGLFDAERASGTLWTAEEFNALFPASPDRSRNPGGSRQALLSNAPVVRDCAGAKAGAKI